jgi:hypothetical protein
LKAAINTLEYALSYRRLAWLGVLMKLPFWIKDALWGAIKALGPAGVATNMAPGASVGGHEFDVAWIDKRMSAASRFILRRASRSRIVRRRRENYRRLLEAVRDLPGGRPLFRELPDEVVPYVFPMVVDDPQRVFPVLKRQGVPILRWDQLAEGVDDTVCPVSVKFSRGLLQFPCHEELRPAELEWMIAQIRSVLGA